MVTAVGFAVRPFAIVAARAISVRIGIRTLPGLMKVIVKAAPKPAAKFILATGVVIIVEEKLGLEIAPGDLVAILAGGVGVGTRVGFLIGSRIAEVERKILPGLI